MSVAHSTTTSTKKAARRRPGIRGGFRRFCLPLFALGLLCAGLWGFFWWEDKPLRQAEWHLRNKEAATALELADGFLRTHRDHGKAIALKARALVQLKRPEEAARLFDQVGAATEEEMQACADAYLMLERWAQALSVLEYLVQLKPDDGNLLHELSACRARLGQYDGAVEAATRFAAIPGNEARGNLLIGMLEHDRGNDRKACDAWSRVLEVTPDASDLQLAADEFLLDYGSLLLQVGEPDKARDLLSRSVAIRASARARSLLGKSCSQLGKDDQAEAQWQAAVKEDPREETARQGLAELAMKRSDFRKALEWLEPLADAPDLSSASAFLLQRACTLAGETETAGRWQSKVDKIRRKEELNSTLNQVMTDSPDSMWGRVVRSWRLAEKGNWEQAGILLSPYVDKSEHPFIRELANAIRTHGTLPDLEGIPLELFH